MLYEEQWTVGSSERICGDRIPTLEKYRWMLSRVSDQSGCLAAPCTLQHMYTLYFKRPLPFLVVAPVITLSWFLFFFVLFCPFLSDLTFLGLFLTHFLELLLVC